MASFTDAGDSVEITMKDIGENVLVDLSGTYSMTILLQEKVGDGAWKTLRTYSTADATVSENYTTDKYNQTFRLFVSVDTSGTCTATLTDNSDKELWTFGGAGVGTPLIVRQSGIKVTGIAEITGLLKPTGGIAAGQGYGKVVNVLDSASYTATQMAAMANSFMILSRSGGIDIVMPAATGSGDIYEFFVLTATTDAYTIEVATGGGDFNGVIQGKADTVTTSERRVAGASDNTLTLGGTGQATGGSVGDNIRIIDIGTNEWFIDGTITQGGTEASPFSAA